MRKLNDLIILIFLFLTLVAASLKGGQATKSQTDNHAGEASVLNLSVKQVQDYAIQHSFETRNARIDIKMAKKKMWETTATGLPHLEGDFIYQNMMEIPTSLVPAKLFDPEAEEGEFIELQFGTKHNATFEATLSQLVFSGSYIVALKSSQVYLNLSKDNLLKSEIEIKETVTRTYYLILLSEENLKVLTRSLANLEKILYETTQLFKAGFREDTDINQLQLSVTDLKNAINSIRRQIDISYKLLKYQMGMALDEEIHLTDTLEGILADIKPGNMLNLKLDIKKHIDFKMVNTQEKSRSLLLQNEKTKFYPTISAFVNVQYNAMRDRFNFFKKGDDKWFRSAVFGISMTIPIFDSGEKSARVTQAKLDLIKAKNTRHQVSEGLRLEHIRARSAFFDAWEKSTSTRENMLLSKKIYDKSRIKFKNGVISSLDLTQIHNQHLNSVTKNIKAVVELLNAKLELDKVLSRL